MFFVLISFFILMMSLSFLTSFITIRFDIAQLAKEWIGLIGSMYTLGMTLSNFQFSKLVSKIGFIRSYVGVAAIIGISMLISGFCFNPFLWTGLRFFTGYCLGAVFIIIESWIMLDSPDDKKGKAIGLYCLVLYMGYALAPYLFRLIGADYTTPYPLMLMSLLCFVSILTIALNKSNPPSIALHQTHLMFKEIFLKAPIGFVQCFASGIMNTIIYVLFPKIMFHHPRVHFTYLLSIVIFGGALSQYPVGWLSDRYKRYDVLLWLNLIIACIIPLCVVFFTSLWLVPLLFVLGGCLLGIYPLTITATCDEFGKKEYFSIVQTLLLIYGLGCIVGPFFAIWGFISFLGNTMGVMFCLFAVNLAAMVYTMKQRF